MYARVKFWNSNINEYGDKTYEFEILKSMEKDIAAGDKVVVDTSYGLKVAEVAEITKQKNWAGSVKKIVSKVWIDDFNIAIAEVRELEILETELAKKLGRANKIAALDVYAAGDTEIAAMVARYKELILKG